MQKVLEMLMGMAESSKQEKADEEIAFAKFSEWCNSESGRLKAESAKAGEEVKQLSAQIGKLESDADALAKEVDQLNSNVADAEAKKKVATQQRETDHKAFVDESTDFAESVDALDRAIEVLQEQNYDRPGTKAALVQLAGSGELPPRARSILAQYAVMLDTSSEESADSFSEAPEANAYEFQSSGLLDLLSKLKDNFSGKLATSQKEEMNSKHAYDMIVLDLADTIQNAEREIREKTVEKERKLEKAALDKKQMVATTDVKAETEKTLSTVSTECIEKRASFEEKQDLRAEEVKAILKAIEILKSPEVQETTKKYLAAIQLQRRSTALVQLEERKGRRRVRDFLAAEGRRLQSQHLVLLSEKLAADPFAKVKNLIEAMIARLQDEAGTDADHEGFCDKEMGKSKITRNKLSEDIDGLTAAVQEGKATILALTESTTTLMDEVTDLRKALGDAADLRRDEKAKNAKTIKEAQAAQKAVAMAKAVLKDFYEKALTATALVQVPATRRWGLKMGIKMGSDEWKALANPGAKAVDTGHKEGMQTFGEAYQGQQDKAEYGVLTLLEVIQSDFEGLEADTESAEVESKKSFENFSLESKKSISVKEKKIDMDTVDKTAAEDKLAKDVAELKNTQNELSAAERYHKQLVPQCVDQGMTFEERTRAREAEIESLKKALELLSS